MVIHSDEEEKPIEYHQPQRHNSAIKKQRIIVAFSFVIAVFLVTLFVLNSNQYKNEKHNLNAGKERLEPKKGSIPLPKDYSQIRNDFSREINKASYGSANNKVVWKNKRTDNKKDDKKYRSSDIAFQTDLKPSPRQRNISFLQNNKGRGLYQPSNPLTLRSTGKSDPNGQNEKIKFLQDENHSGYNSKHLIKPISKYEVKSGTIIPAALYTGINSDLPGTIMARTTSHVYDVSLNYILIPQGSQLIGKYDSKVKAGQERVLFKWYRIIFPNGNSVELDNLPGTSLSGKAGLEGEVDNHTWDLIKGVFLATVFNLGSNINIGSNDSNELAQILSQDAGNNIQKAGDKIIQKKLDRQPTIKIAPGTAFNVLVTRDLILAPYT